MARAPSMPIVQLTMLQTQSGRRGGMAQLVKWKGGVCLWLELCALLRVSEMK